MGLASQVKDIWRDIGTVVSRPAQTYAVAVGTYALFNITGAVYITSLGGIVTGAAVGATQVRLTVNGINVDAAAVAINGAVGTVVLSSLNVAGTLINAAAIPETVATQSRFLSGIQPAAVGVIQAVFSVGTSWTGIWFCMFRKLTETSDVVLA